MDLVTASLVGIGMIFAEEVYQSTSVDLSLNSYLSRTSRVNEALRAVKGSLAISLG